MNEFGIESGPFPNYIYIYKIYNHPLLTPTSDAKFNNGGKEAKTFLCALNGVQEQIKKLCIGIETISIKVPRRYFCEKV